MGQINYFLRQMIMLPVVLYRLFISPVIKPSCRFYPTCSEYALDAIRYYGILKGTYLIFRRILRCHPWCDGGYDPVLPNKEKH
ncbi:membrane protein insertion efficiency factor YidD [Legionella dresdenensis]|uniref:Putative membrane protein insertion efficiency factor n=1 Tax=Legionella dresdenensis TaxID=450200 RepID=A0ABV8CDB1_9GAMM